jgi:hypothetical protein
MRQAILQDWEPKVRETSVKARPGISCLAQQLLRVRVLRTVSLGAPVAVPSLHCPVPYAAQLRGTIFF